LNLPPGTKDQYEQNIASIPPDKRIWWRAHKVLEGETLTGVARQFRVSPGALAQANHLTASSSLEPGARLVVPMAVGTDASLARFREVVPRRLVHYRVRPGDTVDLIADRFEVTPYQVRRWNGLGSSRLVVGRTLRLYVAAPANTVPRPSPARPASPSSHPSAPTPPAQKKAEAPAKQPAPAAAPKAPQTPQ
jgi:membrane-bound lytic murein transglycosylase D